MYDKPFARKLPNGEKVAVILMDTQGLFDNKTSPELTAAIFGLSTLISSYQVYNISKQIQEDKLQQLHFFTEFSQVALRQFNKPKVPEKEEVFDLKKAQGVPMFFFQSQLIVPFLEDHTEPPFQTLEFLVRDWQNFEETCEKVILTQLTP